jgi:hypothetical protein
MKKAILMIAAIAVAVLLPTAQSPASDNESEAMEISAPWARATFAKAKTAAAYMTIENDSHKSDRLIAVKSTIAKKTQIHRTRMVDGVMTMGQVEGIDIDDDDKIQLKPGGYHIMFMGLARPLKEGDSFPLTLVFAKAGEVRIEVQILKPGAMGGGEKHHHHHH